MSDLAPTYTRDSLLLAPAQRRAICRRRDQRVRWWMRAIYAMCKIGGQFVWFCTIRAQVIRPKIPHRDGGFLLACTHLSHLEPFLVSLLTHRPVDWMARIEFFRYRPVAWLLRAIGSFAVNRFGVPVSAVRTAIERARDGRVVGICPEGGVATGANSVCRGGRMKRGVCLIAARANVPVIPCVMLGTHELTRVEPWLPFRRAQLWVAFGEPIHPEPDARFSKAARQRLAEQIQAAYLKLYRELIETYDIDQRDVP